VSISSSTGASDGNSMLLLAAGGGSGNWAGAARPGSLTAGEEAGAATSAADSPLPEAATQAGSSSVLTIAAINAHK
jgi:hypothetical protein